MHVSSNSMDKRLPKPAKSIPKVEVGDATDHIEVNAADHIEKCVGLRLVVGVAVGELDVAVRLHHL